MLNAREKQQMSPHLEVTVTCESLTGTYRTSDGLISVRKAVGGKVSTPGLRKEPYPFAEPCLHLRKCVAF